jgi:hypothetical protein
LNGFGNVIRLQGTCALRKTIFFKIYKKSVIWPERFQAVSPFTST